MSSFKLFFFGSALFLMLCIVKNQSFKNMSLSRFIFNRRSAIASIEINQGKWKSIDKQIDSKKIEEQIQLTLANHTDKCIDLEKVAVHLREQKKLFLYFQIHNQQLILLHSESHIRSEAMIRGLKHLLKVEAIPDLEMIICLEDSLKKEDIHADVPICVFAKNLNDPFLLVPDFTCFANKEASYAFHSHITPLVKKASQMIPWETKKSQALWRGAATGLTQKQWKSSPRIRVCEYSKVHMDMLDAKFSLVKHVTAEQKKYIYHTLPMGEFLTPMQHLNYKYLICIDGNTCTYPGLHWRLLSNSVVLKQETDQIQWFYHYLKPYKHYIPLKGSCEDLIEKITFAKEHDELSYQIATQATDFANRYLSVEGCYFYLYVLLKAYAKTFYPEGLKKHMKHLQGS